MSARARKWSVIAGVAAIAVAAVVAGRTGIQRGDCSALEGVVRHKDGIDLVCVGDLARYDIGFRSLDAGTRAECIREMSACLGVLRDTAGMTVSHLSWVEGRRSYELWIDAPAVRGPVRAQLFALAASLPKAMPACPKEVPPRAFMGTDVDRFDDALPVLGEGGERACR